MFNLNWARELMEAQNIDGLIASSPENFYYVSGYTHYGDGMLPLGKLGIATVIIPKAKEQNPAVIVTDWETEKVRRLTWIEDIRFFETWIHFDKGEIKTSEVTSKPEQFDPVQVISQTLGEKGLEKGNLGVELDYIPLQYYERLKAAIPKANFVDARRLFLDMRTIKSPAEINRFRKAVMTTEKGISAGAKVAREGVTETEIAKAFRRVVAESCCWGIHFLQISE